MIEGEFLTEAAARFYLETEDSLAILGNRLMLRIACEPPCSRHVQWEVE